MQVSSPVSPQGSSSTGQAQTQNDLNSLTSESFLRLLVTQLQNQDPTQPMSNEELLSQISQMRSLQSNIELSETLKSITESLSANAASQQLSTAASLIGKSVTGVTVDGQTANGLVDRAFLDQGKVFVAIGDQRIELGQITSIDLPQAA